MERAFRDIIVLKPAESSEKGVLLLKYTAKFDVFIALFDLDRVLRDYYLVLEPCWAGYCDPSILMFTCSTREVIVQSPEETDFEFIENLSSNLIPVRLGASDWVDQSLFSVEAVPKEYDLIMVANWARQKNHARLFNALPRVKRRPLKVLLIGYEWGGRTRNDIESDMKLYDFEDVVVTIRENISATEVAACLNRSKVFVLLSEKEGSNKALVEALFSNVPAIVYEGFIGGAISKINSRTGILSSFKNLPESIDYMIDNHHRFSPRAWAMEHTGSSNSTRKLNDLIKGIAVTKGEPWTTDIAEKVNKPNLAYRSAGSIQDSKQTRAIAAEYLWK